MYKVLLDENLPVRIKYRLQDACEIYTESDKGRNALENGDLIEAMEQNSFDYLVTSDKNLQYQQNLTKYSIGLIVLNVTDNNYETILSMLEKIKKILNDKIKSKLIIVS